jgi:SAM-dependent methyltransferase
MSDDRSEGYVTGIDYTWGFHREIAPTTLAWAAAIRGHAPPALDGPFRYLELGCGHGFSLDIFAAAHPQASFYGVDFNPNHVENGRRLAREGGLANVEFLEKSFADLAAGSDLPAMDFIVLHGIWSWVSAENRQHIVAFLRQKLRPGGIVYVSYNALPGWAEFVPVRQMMLDVAARTPGEVPVKVKAAVDWVRKFWGVRNHEAASRTYRNRMERILKADLSYVAHEYFNQHWTLFYFRDVVAELEPAELRFVSSATLEEAIPTFHLSKAQIELSREIPGTIEREQARDHLRNAVFRRDLFVRGAPNAEWAKDPSTSPHVRAQLVGPQQSDHQLKKEVTVTAGTITFGSEPEQALFAFVKDGPRPVSDAMDELWSHGQNHARTLTSIRQMVACELLRSWSRAAPPLPPAGPYRIPLAFNEQVVEAAITGAARPRVIAAIHAGTGLDLTLREAHLLQGIVAAGLGGAVEHAFGRLKALNRRLVVSGEPLSGRQAHLDALGKELEAFRKHKLAYFLRLGVLAPR